ncbi:MAG: DUF4838 domain-containing protein [Clostridia bacterium]|nr:DUF4838 domain-containing protein [Clostridia bacterium]
MKIITTQKGDSAEYFMSELKKYIVQMSRGAIVPKLCFAEALQKDASNSIILALLDELSLETSDLADPFIEDIIDINIENGKGYIAGSNHRSILMGIYKYCTSAGCRFIRPGADGDYVPKADITNHSFKYRKKADQPFRGECCEGAISYEHMRDTVYWLPKIGMNMYMIEGLVPFIYMHKWYGHVYNTKLRQKGQCTDYDMLEDYINLLETDIKRTGIQLHTLGHAWLFEGMGIRHDHITEAEKVKNLSPEYTDMLAMVNGKREVQHGNTFYTHFCYSNPKVRKFLVDFMVEYIRKKPHVDFVHMWLADAKNNQCECDECIKMHPSDWYVMLLNELDEELTRMGSDTRIAFIMYVETERPPQKLRLKNPKRFILLSAIGLHYETGYVNEEFTGEVPEYERNNFHPAPNALRLKWHKEWKALSGNIPSVIFEYRFYTDMYCDPGYMQISRETYRDMKSLDKVSFNGCMSDQTHRLYMPTALPLIMMGETLFDTSLDFEKIVTDYFDGAFGKDGEKCLGYLETLSDLFCPSNVRIGAFSGVEEEGLGDIESQMKCWKNNPYVAQKLSKIPSVLDEFLPVIEKNIALCNDSAQRLSWIYLKQHSLICQRLSKLLYEGACGNTGRAVELFDDLRDYLSEQESEFHNVFDLFLFLRSLSFKLGINMPGYFD